MSVLATTARQRAVTMCIRTGVQLWSLDGLAGLEARAHCDTEFTLSRAIDFVSVVRPFARRNPLIMK